MKKMLALVIALCVFLIGCGNETEHTRGSDTGTTDTVVSIHKESEVPEIPTESVHEDNSDSTIVAEPEVVDPEPEIETEPESTPEPEVVELILGIVPVEGNYELVSTNQEFGNPDFEDQYYEMTTLENGVVVQGYLTRETLLLAQLAPTLFPEDVDIAIYVTHRNEIEDYPWEGFEMDEYADVDLLYCLTALGNWRYFIYRNGQFDQVPDFGY